METKQTLRIEEGYIKANGLYLYKVAGVVTPPHQDKNYWKIELDDGTILLAQGAVTIMTNKPEFLPFRALAVRKKKAHIKKGGRKHES